MRLGKGQNILIAMDSIPYLLIGPKSIHDLDRHVSYYVHSEINHGSVRNSDPEQKRVRVGEAKRKGDGRFWLKKTGLKIKNCSNKLAQIKMIELILFPTKPFY